MAHETTLYSVLRIPENASSDDIKQAFRKLVKLWHPDLHPDDMSAEKRMQEINEAYTVLSDPVKKQKYDNTLSQKRAALRAKEEEQARKEARARAAAAASAAASATAASAAKPSYKDPDRAPYTNSGNFYEDFTKPSASSNVNEQEAPFVVSTGSSKVKDQVRQAGASEELTASERRMEDFTIALCVLFPILIPIVYKHIKESYRMYPNSLHYQDSLLSMRIVTGFAIPLWIFMLILLLKGVLGAHV